MRLVHVTSNNNVPGATKSTFHGNRNYETERVLESLARSNVARVDKSPWSFSLSLFTATSSGGSRVGSYAWLIVFKLVASAPIKSVQRPVQEQQERDRGRDTPSYPSVRGKTEPKAKCHVRVARDNNKLVYQTDIRALNKAPYYVLIVLYL